MPSTLHTHSVDIVICIHNSPEDVEACVKSVAAWLRPKQRIIAVDDGSQKETRELAAQLFKKLGKPHLLIRHDEALGYTRAANVGLKASEGDFVILLNSDTIVSEGWVENLLEAARAPDIGIIGPMSNAASWQSVPDIFDSKGDFAVNPLPRDFEVQHMQRALTLSKHSGPLRVPLVNGFCFAIRRSVIDAIGYLDEEAFPTGYGEENDYCFRMTDAGFMGAISTGGYVYHAKSKSFTHERRKVLSKKGSEAFRGRYGNPRIDRAIKSMKFHPQIEAVRKRMAALLQSLEHARQGQVFTIHLACESDSFKLFAQKFAESLRNLGIETYVHTATDEGKHALETDLKKANNQVLIVDPLLNFKAFAPYIRLAHKSFLGVFASGLPLSSKPAQLETVINEYAEAFEHVSVISDIPAPSSLHTNASRETTVIQLPFARYTDIQSPFASIFAGNNEHELVIAAVDPEHKERIAKAITEPFSIVDTKPAAGALPIACIFFDDSPCSLASAAEKIEDGVPTLLPWSELVSKSLLHETHALFYTDSESLKGQLECLCDRNSGLASRLNLAGSSRAGTTPPGQSSALMLTLELAALYKGKKQSFTAKPKNVTSDIPRKLDELDTKGGILDKSPQELAKLSIRIDHEEAKYLAMFDLSSETIHANLSLMEKAKSLKNIPTRNILWLLPTFDVLFRGGIYTIFRAANAFSTSEGSHNIIVLFGKLKKPLSELKSDIDKAFPDLKYTLKHISTTQQADNLPASDIAFCTLWTTAYLLAGYNKCKAKYYFIQDFEPSFYPGGSLYALIQQTYELGYFGIANTIGVGEKYRQFNPYMTAFEPAVDRSLYAPVKQKPSSESGIFRVVFYGRPRNKRNGFLLGLESLRRVKLAMGDKVQIISVGSEFDPAELGLEGLIECAGMLPNHQAVAELYQSADIGLTFMYSAHPSYQPFEYMATGCVTVTNYNPSNMWFLKNNQNCRIVPNTPSGVSEGIVHLLENDSLRETIIQGGYETVSKLSWEKSMQKIVQFVKSPSPQHQPLHT